MSDEELDREWAGNNRPQSTMARSFSLALNDLFKIDNSLADLDAAVSEKKKAVSTQTSELEALEARLLATEERLKKASSPGPQRSSSGRSSPHARTPLGDTFGNQPTTKENPTSPLSSEFKNASRPSTAKTARPQTKDGRPGSAWKGQAAPSYAPPMPGALPPTPGASEGETDSDYVLVETRNVADVGEDGDIPPQK